MIKPNIMIKPRKGTELYKSLEGNKDAIYFIYKGSVYYQKSCDNYSIYGSCYGSDLKRFRRDVKKENEFVQVSSLVEVN